MNSFSKDTGHQHWVDLQSSWSGNHQHEYKDIWHSDVHCKGPECFEVPERYGSSMSHHNCMGSQLSRYSADSGNHIHSLAGHVKGGSAQISYTGGNQHFDNRPLFTSVQFIIYISN
jgi:hypothetical protein